MSTESNEGRESQTSLARAPYIGRVNEREAISTATERSIRTSTLQIVSVIGSAGVGKSRLVVEAVADLSERLPELRVYRGACQARSGVQGALAKILRARLGLSDGQDAVTQAIEMRTRVSELFGSRRADEMLHFLGAFLGLKFGASPFSEAFDEDPHAMKEVSRAVLRKFFEVDAQRAPLMLVIEDLHHATPDGIRLLRDLFESMRGAPITVLVTARPELLARAREWPQVLGDRHLRVDLGPLAASEVRVLVRSMLARATPVPVEVIESAVEMSSGNPMLAEQLVQIFFEQRVLSARPDGTIEVDTSRLDHVSLPMSVEDAVQQRLDVLAPPERELLEQGAVMGPVFWVGGLVVLGRAKRTVPELWGGGEDLAPHVRDLLHSLELKDYVLRMPDSSIPGDEEWIFKHNLERETLLTLLAPEDTRDYHLMLAEWLEFRLPERGEEQLDLLAHHYERGGRAQRAAACLLESADRARTRYANAKAVEQYQRGLSLLGDQDARARLQAHHHLGDVLQTLGRPESALAEFREMLAIAYRLDLRAKGGAAHNRIGRLYRETAQLDRAMKHLGTGLVLFESSGDARGIASSLDDIGKVHWLRGDYDQALRFLQDALSRREALGDPRSIALSLNNIGLVFQDSGQYRAALDALQRALEIRRRVDDQQGVCVTLNNLGTIHQDKGEDEMAVHLWLEALQVAREIGDRRRQAVLMLNVGEGQYRLNNPSEAIRILRDVEALSADLGDRILLAEAWRGLGKGHLQSGDIDSARSYLERALALFEQTRSRVHVGIAKRSLGECLASYDYESAEGQRAERYFREALDVFEDAGAELELARTALSLGAFLARAPESAGEGLADEADRLRLRAENIFAELRIEAPVASSGPLFADEGRPGSEHPLDLGDLDELTSLVGTVDPPSPVRIAAIRGDLDTQ